MSRAIELDSGIADIAGRRAEELASRLAEYLAALVRRDVRDGDELLRSLDSRDRNHARALEVVSGLGLRTLTDHVVAHRVGERLGLRRVATFDADFTVYRFGPERSRAFDVLR